MIPYLLAGLIGCGSDTELKPFPSTISWGEIDFGEAMPDSGYSPQTIDLNNTGEKEISDISIDKLDLNINHDCPGSQTCKRLCLQGFDDSPAALGALAPDESYGFVISVCDYIEETGERDEEITGQIEISHSGSNSPVTINWSFTPVFQIAQQDTGQ